MLALKQLDLVLLAVSLPVFLLTGLPMLGWARNDQQDRDSVVDHVHGVLRGRVALAAMRTWLGNGRSGRNGRTGRYWTRRPCEAGRGHVLSRLDARAINVGGAA